MSVELRQDVPLPEYIETDEQARELLRFSLRKVETDVGDMIGWDTETHAKHIPIPKKPPDPITDTVTFWSLCFADTSSGERQYRRWCLQQQHFLMFAPLLENPLACITAWNAKYDAHIAWNCNVNVWNATILDGLAMAKLHDENLREYSLKARARDWCGLNMTPYKALFDTDIHGNKAKEFTTSLYDLPLGLVVDYASYDAFACLYTAEWIKEKLAATVIHPNGRTMWDHFCEFEIPFTETLWRMERRGLPLDLEYMKAQIPKAQEEIDSIEREINRISGRPVNINSPLQLSALFFNPPEPGVDAKGKPIPAGFGLKPVKMTKGGSRMPQPSTDEEVLTLLGEMVGIPGEVARQIMRCRKLYKIKGTYMDALVTMAEYFPDGRIHPNFHQFGARTGRISATNPNSMNMPRPDGDEFGIRRAFQAPSGKKLIVSDFEQLEMRIMADRSQDAKMIQAIRNGKDLHSFTAGEMEDGISYEEVAAAKKADEPNDRQKWLKGLRQSMKAVGFGIIYGAGPSKIAENITINEEDAWRAVEEMDAEELGNQIARKMRDNPLLSVDQAQRLVGDAAIARGKIEAYFRVFPRVKSFMDGTPGNCKFRMQNDLLGNQQFRPDNSDPETSYNWDIVQDREGAQLLTRTGHSKPFGFVQTYLGRYRRLEDIDHRQYAYRGHAEREAVNCFDAETEALTQRGWVKGFELLPNDMFLTKNADTGELKWNLAVRRWFYPDYRGPMVRLGNGRSFETLTTPEHRWLVTDKKTKTTREMKSEQFLQLSSKQSDYAIHMAGSYSQKWSAYTDDFATLVGWTLTDGCYGETYLNIAQTKEHRRLEIEALLNRMGLRWNSYDPGEGRSVQYKVSGNVVSLIKGILPDKTLTPEFVLSLGDSARQALYTSMMAGDGFEHPSKTHLFVAGSEVRADMFQFLCILLGRSTSKKFREYQAPKQNGSKGCWEVRILRRATAQTSCRELIEDYEGGVWCVTVPNSFAVFRRAGRVFVSGNTVIQGTAADLIKGAMLRIESNEELNMMGAQLLNQIHDELVIEIPEEYAEAAMPIIEECMMHPFVPGEDPLCVPIPTDGKICNDWAEGK